MSGEVVVFPTSLQAGRALREQLAQEQFRVLGFAPISGMMIVAIEPGLEDAAVEYFRSHEGVRIAERSHRGRLGSCGGPGTPPSSDPDFAMQWHLHNTEQEVLEAGQTGTVVGICGVDIDAIRGWERTRGSSDIWMAVFDSGVELDNPEFEGRLAPPETWISLSCPWYGSPGPSVCCCPSDPCDYGEPFDVHGHGTWVAATAMANHDDEGVMGVDPGCTLLPVRISAMDDGKLARTIIALEMIDAANGPSDPYERVRVINMSLLGVLGSIDDGQSQAFRDALQSLREEGVIIVVISGNEETPVLQEEQADLFLPSVSDDVISVGATDNRDRRLDSSVAPTAVNSGRGDALDFVAPGFGILTAGCEQQSFASCDQHCYYAGQFDPPISGTSAAAPQVSAIVSLLLARADVLSIELDFDDVYELLSEGAVKLGTSATTHDKDYGWGRVSLYGSLMALERLHYECDADITHTDDENDWGYGVPDGKVDADDATAYLDLWDVGNPIANLTTSGHTTPGGGGLNGTPDEVVDEDDLTYFLAFYANCSSLPCPACPP